MLGYLLQRIDSLSEELHLKNEAIKELMEWKESQPKKAGQRQANSSVKMAPQSAVPTLAQVVASSHSESNAEEPSSVFSNTAKRRKRADHTLDSEGDFMGDMRTINTASLK